MFDMRAAGESAGKTQERHEPKGSTAPCQLAKRGDSGDSRQGQPESKMLFPRILWPAQPP